MGETLLEHSFLTSSMVGLGLIDTTLGLFIGSVTASDKSSRVLEENVVSSCFTLVLGTVLAPLDFFTFMSGGCSRSIIFLRVLILALYLSSIHLKDCLSSPLLLPSRYLSNLLMIKSRDHEVCSFIQRMRIDISHGTSQPLLVQNPNTLSTYVVRYRV